VPSRAKPEKLEDQNLEPSEKRFADAGQPHVWVAKTSSAPKSLICSDLRPSCHPLFLVPWPGPTPREQQFARHRLDKWARSIGFQSPTDDRVQERLREYQAFKKAAAHQIEIEQEKRHERSRADEHLDLRQIDVKISEALRRMRGAAPAAGSC
jgi:uncharacterized membrane protein